MKRELVPEKTTRKRKPRGFKKDGTRSLDMCTCYSFHCDPMTVSRKFSEKIHRRLQAGLCGACGGKPCKCRSKK